jgi:hypothetical protein
MTLVTALSEVGGLNPVSQAALTYLKPGDVVQLEIVQVSLSFFCFCFSEFTYLIT